MDEHGQTWTNMDNGKIEYFDADYTDLGKDLEENRRRIPLIFRLISF
jgi:hypothetical protein